MHRKIVFINQATGYLTIDIINKFTEEFDEVALVTGSIRVQNIQLNNKVRISTITRYDRSNTFRKAISWLAGTTQIFFLLKLKYRDFEKFFFTIPPTAYLMAQHLRPPFTITIFDLYPDALKANGFGERGTLYRWWLRRNEMIFPKAHRVYVLSENMKSRVLEYSERTDVRVVSNWSAFSGSTPVKKSMNKFLKGDSLEGKFVIQYSGNIGVTHKVETLVEVAIKLRFNKEIEFQIIGRGGRSQVIDKLIVINGLENCNLLPFRNDDELYESLCSADLAVITLVDKTTDISVPSKVYNIMAAGLPIMGIVPLNSEIAQIVNKYNLGKVFNDEDINAMCDFILYLKQNPEEWNKYSQNSLQAAREFSSANASKYLEHYTI